MADPIKQYINLEPDGKDRRLGRVVRIKTKITVKKARSVHLWLKPEGSNIAVAKLRGPQRGGVVSAGNLHVAQITENDGSLAFDLMMSVQGGDKFSVEVSRDRKKSKIVTHSDKYEVWRKLYYQLSKMKATYSFPEGDLVGEYKKHFIELEKTSTENVPHKENLETDELPSYQRHFKGVKKPFEAHVVLIDRQCDSEVLDINDTLSVATKTYRFPSHLEKWPFGDWLVEAKCKTGAGAFSAAGIAVTQVAVGARTGVKIDVSGAGVNPATTPVDVKVRARGMKGEYTGDATYPPHVFIAIGKPRSNDSKCKTVAHEIGHGIGMVPRTGHTMQYDNANGGSGSHCRTGASPNQTSKAQGGAFTGTYNSGTCVMFAFSSEHFTYCATCIEHVKKAMLFKSDMQGRGWG